MYHLWVFYEGEKTPRSRHDVDHAGDVLALIPELLQAQHGCERVVVMHRQNGLFAVDCKGNQIS